MYNTRGEIKKWRSFQLFGTGLLKCDERRSERNHWRKEPAECNTLKGNV